MLSGKVGRASISALLDPDKRAAAVRVHDMTGVGGFVLPGDRVDVLITRTLPGQGERTITDILARKSVSYGKSVSVRVDPGARRLINNKHTPKLPYHTP